LDLSSYFKILELSPSASLEDVRSAYKRLVFLHHPDRNLEPSKGDEQFLKIVDAYEVLKEELEKGRQQKVAPQSRRKPPKKRKPQKRTSSEAGHNINLRYNVYIALEDIVRGTSKIIRYIRSIDSIPENVQIKVEIPAGTQSGQRLKIQGFGNHSGSQKGDLFVIANHLPHPVFDVNGYHIEVDVPVTYLQMLGGGPTEVPTLDGPQTLILNQCEFTNVHRVLENQGLPIDDSGQRGNLLVYFSLDQPGSLSRAEENEIEKWKRNWPKSLRLHRFEEMLRKEN